MMRLRTRIRSARRAFVMPMVLLLSFMGTLAVAIALQRASVQRLMVQRQVTEYRRHHDMLGAQAVIRYWLSQFKGRNDALSSLARSEGAAHEFEMPGGVRIQVYIRDGQGLAKADLSGINAPKKEWFEWVLYRLPTESPGLVRRIGPAEISVNSAPKPVLAALVDDGDDFADAVVAARADRPLDAERLRQILDQTVASQESIAEAQRLVTFTPTLWTIEVLATDRVNPDDQRRFAGVVEMGDSQPRIYEWREVKEAPDSSDALERASGARRPLSVR